MSIARTYLNEGDKILVRNPEYTNFYVYVESVGAEIELLIEDDLHEMNLDYVINEINKEDIRGFYMSNPNNPTGRYFDKTQIEYLMERTEKDKLIIIDEAYIHFADLSGQGAIDLVEKYDNLFICRTFSKAFSLAGLRMGYVASSPQNITHLNVTRNGKNVTMIGQVAAEAAIDDWSNYQKYIQHINETKQWFISQLRELGVETFDSHANYCLVRTKNSKELIEYLSESEIYVRDRSYLTQMENYLRITIWQKEYMIRVLELIRNYLDKV